MKLNHRPLSVAIIYWTGAAFAVSLLAMRDISLKLPAPGEPLPFLRCSFFVVLVGVCWLGVRRLLKWTDGRVLSSWWDPSKRGSDGPIDWPEVYRLVAYDDSLDPLEGDRRSRTKEYIRSVHLRVFIAAALIWGTFFTALELLHDSSAWASVSATAKAASGTAAATSASNITAYVALITACATLAFTYYQLRAKVRADSRQAWIIHARKLLGEVIAKGDTFRIAHDRGSRLKAEELWADLNTARLEFELMLNPSEKDHRLLLYLIQRYCSRHRKDAKHVQDADILRRSIQKSSMPMDAYVGCECTQNSNCTCAPDPDTDQPDLGPDWNRIIYSRNRAEQVSYILRLSHVVLKREWERVKHTR